MANLLKISMPTEQNTQEPTTNISCVCSSAAFAIAGLWSEAEVMARCNKIDVKYEYRADSMNRCSTT